MEETAFNPQKAADEIMLKKLENPRYVTASEMNAILARIAQLRANSMSAQDGMIEKFCDAVDNAIQEWLTKGKIDLRYGKEIEREVDGAELKCINRRNAEREASMINEPTEEELLREAKKRINKHTLRDLPDLDLSGRDRAGRSV